jgi:hypothetical protein
MQHPLCLTHHVSYPLNVNDPSDGLRNESGANGSDYCGCRCVTCETCNLIPEFNLDLCKISQQMHYSDGVLITSCSSYMFRRMYVIIREPSVMCPAELH